MDSITPEKQPANLEQIIDDVVTDTVPPSTTLDAVSEPNGRLGTDTAGTPPSPSALPPSSAPEGKRGRGRPKKDKTDKRPKLEGVEQKPQTNFDDAGIEPCAEMAVGLVAMSGMMLGGETAAMTPPEKNLAKDGFVAYFKAKGIDSIPPWAILTGALMPYYMRIATTTPAKSAFSNVFMKLGKGIKNLLNRKKANARFNSGNDTKRENDTGEEAGAPSAQ